MYKLLIIDDQKSILQMLQRRFARFDYDVLTANNKKEAFEMLENNSFDLILLDYMMPKVSGFDLFLSFHEEYNIPVIMMTAHSSINLVIEFMRNGGADFIEKPLDMDLLLLRIERAIKQSRLLKDQIAVKEKAEADLKETNSELLEKTKKLEQKNKELDAFTAAVSHDLKAPISNIKGFLSILKKKVGAENSDEEISKYFNYIEEGTNKMDLLISELLGFAKMEQVKKNIETINSQELVAEIISLINANNKNPTKIEVGELPEIKGDLILIRQVFYNLIHNAVKYSHKKTNPMVSITAVNNKDETYFAIKDNGVGFNQEYADQLFNVFTRLHPNEFEGIGIGLANVKRIVERHNGRIWAKGKEGEGATFYFSLPDTIQ